MHELAVTQSILDIALTHAEKARAVRVVAVNLVIGELASIVDDSVQFYWDFISKGTPAQDARLHFRRLPLELRCADCGRSFLPEGDSYACPSCHGTHVRVSQGQEFQVESIEVE